MFYCVNYKTTVISDYTNQFMSGIDHYLVYKISLQQYDIFRTINIIRETQKSMYLNQFTH